MLSVAAFYIHFFLSFVFFSLSLVFFVFFLFLFAPPRPSRIARNFDARRAIRSFSACESRPAVARGLSSYSTDRLCQIFRLARATFLGTVFGQFVRDVHHGRKITRSPPYRRRFSLPGFISPCVARAGENFTLHRLFTLFAQLSQSRLRGQLSVTRVNSLS